MSDRQALFTGGCQCGRVRYALLAQPEGVHFCHCRMCQKAVGGPFAALAPVRMHDLAWTRGTPSTFRSSTVAYRDFCPACGTPLTFRYGDSAWTCVTIGSLDRPADVPPTRHYGIEARLHWLDAALLRSLPEEPTSDGDSPGRLAGMQSFQHPDHDTSPGWLPPKAAT